MTSSYREIIRRHSRPLQPLDTEEPSRRGSLQPIDAVLFDIYGTLLISGSGDIGGGDASARGEAVAAALQAVGVVLRGPPEMALQVWRAEIDRRHQEARQAGVDFPEVDILEVWRGALAEWTARGWTAPASGVDLAALAVEFEVRANPVWPMPGMLQTLETLRAAGKTLGVISNAQFFTRETFPALVERTLDDLGCEPDLQFYSYQHARAKPSLALYQLAMAALQRRGISPGRVLYVGNDIRNDIGPAARCGFRTALFAGDARSLRRREGDPQCAGIVPDVVVRKLCDLVDCIV
jgi:putative hydrolase of the HAD superfamily